MLRKVTIERFRGFRRLVAELDRTTVILGPNSSGKTSLLHAVRLACDAVEIGLDAPDATPRATGSAIQVCSASNTILADPSRLAPLANFRHLFVDAEVADGTDLRITLAFDPADLVSEVAVRLVYSRNAQLKLDVAVKSAKVATAAAHLPPKSKHRPARLREQLEAVRPLALFVPAFYGVTRTEEYRTQPLVARMLGGGDQSHIVRNLVARLDGEALARLNTFLRRTVGASIAERTSASDVEKFADLSVMFRDDNGVLELSSAGAGLIALVALFAALERARLQRTAAPERSVIFLLDEPEAHLHPRLAAEVADAIATTAADFGVQLALATHSVEVINRLGRRDSTAVLSIDRSRTEPLSLRSEAELVTALDAFCDLTPFTSLSFLASRRLMLVEGPTDRRVLDACARVLYQTDDARLRRFRENVVVELEGVGNVSAKGVLTKLLTPSVFARIDAKRPVRASLALDRDWEREPHAVLREKLAPHFESVEVVWTRHSIESLFLEPSILAAWLGSHLDAGVDVATPAREAIAIVNADVSLLDDAVDGRTKIHRRPDPSTKRALVESEAQKRARAEVRGAPETFQHGKRRAARVLDEIRERLSVPARKAMRGSLVDLIDGANAATVVAADAVPAEIRAFLDALTEP